MLIDGLTDGEQTLVTALLKQLEDKQARNLLRASYYDGKNALRDMGMSLPPAFRRMATVLGWPSKAVDTLSQRCHLSGFVLPGGTDVGLDDLWDDNNLAIEASQAHVSALIHAVAWLVAHQGAEGEPPVLITAKDALSGTGQWNRRTRRLDAFLSIIDTDAKGKPSHLVLYLPVGNVIMRRDDLTWQVDRTEHKLGRVPVEPLVYRPRLSRPLGGSRISRTVMAMTDMAMRTVLRSEVNAELYSIPQRVLLGASERAFKNPDGTVKAAWQVVFGRVWGVERDEDGNIPQIQQLQQTSQQPHMDQLRTLAFIFSGETSIPPESLGFRTEANPASADAYYASREDLIHLAEETIGGFAPAWQRTAVNALQLRDGLDAPADEWRKVRARFRSPQFTSNAAMADAMTKVMASPGFAWMAESDVSVELLGFDEVTTARLLADKRRAQARATVAALTGGAGGVGG